MRLAKISSQLRTFCHLEGIKRWSRKTAGRKKNMKLAEANSNNQCSLLRVIRCVNVDFRNGIVLHNYLDALFTDIVGVVRLGEDVVIAVVIVFGIGGEHLVLCRTYADPPRGGITVARNDVEADGIAVVGGQGLDLDPIILIGLSMPFLVQLMVSRYS